MRKVVLVLGATLATAVAIRLLYCPLKETAPMVAEAPPPASTPSDPFPRAGKQRPVFSPKLQGLRPAPVPASPGVGDEEELKAVLGEARQAAGYARLAALKTGVVASGEAKTDHVETAAPVRYSFLFASKGRFVERLEGGLNAIFGHDGTTTWALSWSRTQQLQSLEASSSGQLAAWVRSGYWLDSPPPYKLSIAPGEGDPSHVAIKIEGSGIQKAHLFVDRLTWLPTTLVVTFNDAVERWTFEDYAVVEGIRVARRVEHNGMGKVGRYELTDVAIGKRSAAEMFEPLRFQAGRFKNSESTPANAPS
jgi:hypothetical protein